MSNLFLHGYRTLREQTSARWHLITAGVIAAVGYGTTAFKLAGLSWDGSWYLFRSLQDGAPFIPHLRYGTYPILWLIVQASKIIHTPATIGICYGLLLSLFPLAALVLSWWFLRGEQNSPLRVWPTLGILLAALPGQFCLMSEATPAAQLFWPIAAIIVAGPPGVSGGICLILLSVAAAFLHPTAAFVFGVAATLFARQTWTRFPASKSGWLWAGGFVAAAVAEIVLTLHSASDYERTQASWGEIARQFNHSVSGFPLFLLLATYLVGALLLTATGALRLPAAPKDIRPLCNALLLAMAGAGSHWANEPTRWYGLLDYRRFVLPAMLPLALMAAWHHRHLGRAPRPTGPAFPWLLPGIAVVSGVVLTTQAFSWQSLLEHFAREISLRSNRERFVAAAELPFTDHTPLRHWTACPLSLLLQHREPAGLFVLKRTDVEAISVRVNPWEELPLTDRWFKLGHLAGAPDDVPR